MLLVAEAGSSEAVSAAEFDSVWTSQAVRVHQSRSKQSLSNLVDPAFCALWPLPARSVSPLVSPLDDSASSDDDDFLSPDADEAWDEQEDVAERS